MAQETHLISRRDTAATGKDLKRYAFSVKAYHLRQGHPASGKYLGDIGIPYALGFDGYHVTGYLDYIRVEFMH